MLGQKLGYDKDQNDEIFMLEPSLSMIAQEY